jgi:hypothetical protein
MRIASLVTGIAVGIAITIGGGTAQARTTAAPHIDVIALAAVATSADGPDAEPNPGPF